MTIISTGALWVFKYACFGVINEFRWLLIKVYTFFPVTLVFSMTVRAAKAETLKCIYLNNVIGWLFISLIHLIYQAWLEHGYMIRNTGEWQEHGYMIINMGEWHKYGYMIRSTGELLEHIFMIRNVEEWHEYGVYE